MKIGCPIGRGSVHETCLSRYRASVVGLGHGFGVPNPVAPEPRPPAGTTIGRVTSIEPRGTRTPAARRENWGGFVSVLTPLTLITPLTLS